MQQNKENSIPAIILCGGKGTRLSEETISKPKPMVEIGGEANLMAYYEVLQLLWY